MKAFPLTHLESETECYIYVKASVGALFVQGKVKAINFRPKKRSARSGRSGHTVGHLIEDMECTEAHRQPLSSTLVGMEQYPLLQRYAGDPYLNENDLFRTLVLEGGFLLKELLRDGGALGTSARWSSEHEFILATGCLIKVDSSIFVPFDSPHRSEHCNSECAERPERCPGGALAALELKTDRVLHDELGELLDRIGDAKILLSSKSGKGKPRIEFKMEGDVEVPTGKDHRRCLLSLVSDAFAYSHGLGVPVVMHNGRWGFIVTAVRQRHRNWNASVTRPIGIKEGGEAWPSGALAPELLLASVAWSTLRDTQLDQLAEAMVIDPPGRL